MPIARDTGGQDFEPAPAGNHVARCISVISLGTQHSEKFDRWSPKVLLAWELPNETITVNGREVPMVITKEFTLSLSPKGNLRKCLEAWRNRAFTPDELVGWDVAKVLGAPCMLQVVHNQVAGGKTYANVAAVGSIPKGLQVPEQVHESTLYELEYGTNDIYEALPEWIRDKIRVCREWTTEAAPPEEQEDPGRMTAVQPPPSMAETDDEVPF